MRLSDWRCLFQTIYKSRFFLLHLKMNKNRNTIIKLNHLFCFHKEKRQNVLRKDVSICLKYF